VPTATWERLPEARRRAVLDAAEAEFAERGFSGGSLNTIVREAGIAKGSLFQYFEDKADLYAHLAELASVRIRARMEEHISGLDWGGDFFGALGSMMLFWTRYFGEHPGDRAMTAAVNLEPEESTRTAVRVTVNRHYVEVLAPLVATAKADGSLRPDADTDAFLALLMLILPHLAIAPHHAGLDPVLGLFDASREDLRATVARLNDVFRAAFGPRP
jgi:AcrR family transcriptional regulator